MKLSIRTIIVLALGLTACDQGYKFGSISQQSKTTVGCDPGPAPTFSGETTLTVGQAATFGFSAASDVNWAIQTPEGTKQAMDSSVTVTFSQAGVYQGAVTGLDLCEQVHFHEFAVTVNTVVVPPVPPVNPPVPPVEPPVPPVVPPVPPVTPEPQPITDNFFIDSNGNKLDVVIVIDNSPSMWEEQAKMAKRFSSFIQRLSGLDWQLAMITTDPRDGNKPNRGGQFIHFSGFQGLLSINKQTPNVEQVFANTVKRKETGTSDEQGIHSLLKMVSRPENSFFFRPQAHLATIIVSDEDERSDGRGLKNENRPETLVATLASAFQSQKTYSNHSILLRPGFESRCPQSGSAAVGHTYERLSQLTGGVVGDLCANDYGDILKNIGDSIVGKTYSALLKCAPKGGQVAVKYSPQPATRIEATLAGNELTLAPHPPVGTTVEVTYRCQ